MAKVSKQTRFAEMETLDNVFHAPYELLINHKFELKGNWCKNYFNNDKPIVLELGCGRGEYTVGLAAKYPDKNFVGIDIKGARIWIGAKSAIEQGLTNVAFVRTKIDMVEEIFDKDEINEIWITFPDPQPRNCKHKKRLTSQHFINKYKNIIIPQGIIHLKTDNEGLFDYSMQTIKEYGHTLFEHTKDVYNSPIKNEAIEFRTYYEDVFSKQGHSICYLRFSLA